MKHRLPLVVAVALLAVALPASTAAAKTDHHHERIDLGRPARGEARSGLRQEVPSRQRQVPARPGRLRRRRRRRRRGPRDDRQLVARPEAHRPGRARVQQDRPRRDLRRHQHRATRSPNLVQDAGPGDLRRRASATGARSRAPTSSGTIDLFVRTAASGYPGRVPEDLHGPERKVASSASQKASNGLVQQAVKSDPNGDRLRVAAPSPRALNAVAYKGVACTLRNAKSGQYGGVAQLLAWSPAAQPAGRRRRSSSTGSSSSKAAQQIIAHATGSRCSERRCAGRLAEARRPRNRGGPARRASARRAGVRRCSC